MEKDLVEIEFPVLFYVCVTPAFHMEKILEAGYSNLWFYFMGKSRFGNTYGWAGHKRNGSVFSTPESLLQAAVVDIKDILRDIRLKFRGREGSKFFTKTRKNYVTATLRRPNYPGNCYNVDINKLKPYVKGKSLKGFFQIQFNFHQVKGHKVEIILEDINRALSRTYKYNKFGTWGSRIIISNLLSNSYK